VHNSGKRVGGENAQVLVAVVEYQFDELLCAVDLGGQLTHLHALFTHGEHRVTAGIIHETVAFFAVETVDSVVLEHTAVVLLVEHTVEPVQGLSLVSQTFGAVHFGRPTRHYQGLQFTRGSLCTQHALGRVRILH